MDIIDSVTSIVAVGALGVLGFLSYYKFQQKPEKIEQHRFISSIKELFRALPNQEVKPAQNNQMLIALVAAKNKYSDKSSLMIFSFQTPANIKYTPWQLTSFLNFINNGKNKKTVEYLIPQEYHTCDFVVLGISKNDASIQEVEQSYGNQLLMHVFNFNSIMHYIAVVDSTALNYAKFFDLFPQAYYAKEYLTI